MQTLVSGAPRPIDIEDWRRNTVYQNDYNEDHITIKLFWEILGEMSDAERKKVLKFATSCPKPPLQGFKELNPKFGIGCSSSDQERLPSSNTCFNFLKLPAYTNKTIMKEKLKYAIETETGFYLS